MDKREYLRSLGFQVGERGRFSAEMKAALAKADVAFTISSPKKDESIILETIIPDVPPQKVMREPQQLFGYTQEGSKVGFVTCGRCHYHMMYCDCPGGVQAPSIVSVCDDPRVALTLG